MVSLEPLIKYLPAWLLVLFRLSGIFLYGPLYGSSNVPARIKVLIALGLSFCVFPMLLDPAKPSAAHMLAVVDQGISLWAIVGIVLAELTIGLTIGFGASLPIVGMQWAGRMIAQQMGLGIAEVYSPGEEQGAIVSRMFFMLAMFIFLILGGHRLVLMTLVGTFDHIPLGSFVYDGQVLDLVLGLMTSMVNLAMRVAAPLIGLIFLEMTATGLIARTLPQLNILSIGFAVKIMIGSLILIGAMHIKSHVFVDVILQDLDRLARFFGPIALSPS